MTLRSISILLSVLLLCSCGENKKQAKGPIVMGDSSTIVTETDEKYLGDYVDDIELKVFPKDTFSTSDTDSSSAPVAAPENQPVASTTVAPASAATDAKSGLKIPFKEVTVFIPGIETRTFREQDYATASGASFQLTQGELSGKKLELSGANITKVYQRFLVHVVAKNELGTLPVDALNDLSEWAPVSGKGNTYTISGLSRAHGKNLSAAQLRNAVTRAARSKRLSRQMIQKWERSLRKTRSVTQPPFKNVLRSVMWKIEGKDANGRPFQKQVRIDLPA